MENALVEYGISNFVRPIPENVENFENFAGEGVFGKINGNYIYIGNRRIDARADSKIGDYYHVLSFRSSSCSLFKICDAKV